MKYQLVLFDLDGTILDTVEDLTDSMNYCLSYYGLNNRTYKEIRSFLGHGIKVLTEKSFAGSNVDFDEAFNMFAKHYKENSMNKTKPYDGIIELIKTLKLEGVKVAVISNKADHIVKELCQFYFKDLFDYVIGQREDIEKKPSKAMVDHVINKFNINKEDSIYIGDSEVDIETANNVKIDVIAVTYGFRDKDYLESLKPTYIANNALEILKILK